MMLYKILNYLFGWDYIYFKNCAAQGVKKIHTDAYGNPYYIWAVNSRVHITHKKQVMWLTCEAEKYLEENLERSHFN